MKYSLKPVAKRLSELLNQNVVMAEDVIGDSAKAAVAAMKDGDVVLLENVRFHKEEEKNEPAFAKELASLAEIFVNDAFGTAHRAHASTAGVADYLPAVCGYLIKKEIEFMGGALENPARPFVAILGGAKAVSYTHLDADVPDVGGEAWIWLRDARLARRRRGGYQKRDDSDFGTERLWLCKGGKGGAPPCANFAV